jgi:hypothetical protein
MPKSQVVTVIETLLAATACVRAPKICVTNGPVALVAYKSQDEPVGLQSADRVSCLSKQRPGTDNHDVKAAR